MRKKHEPILGLFDSFINLVDDMLLTTISPKDSIGEFSTLFLARYCKSMRALRLLIINGFEEDSNSQLRVLLEQAITILYIYLKPEDRIRQYNDYRFIDQYKTMIKAEEYRSFYDFDWDREEIIDNYERVKDRYKSKVRWSDKNLKEMAKEIGPIAEDWYEFIYSMNSSFVHSDIYSLKDVVEQDDSGTMWVCTEEREFEADFLMSRVLQFTYIVLLEACRSNSVSIEEVEQTWKNAMRVIVKESKRWTNDEFNFA